MSIFSRKSKSQQPQAVNGKQNGHAYPRGSKNAKSSPIPNPQFVDPIVERMALQAASRRRMNSDTPDYSISSAPSGTSTPNQGYAASLVSRAAYERPHSRILQDNGLAKTASAESKGNSIEATNSHRQVRDSHRFRKSTGTISSQTAQTAYLNGVDPDLQKMRMPATDRPYPSPQNSRDSGYASVARTPTIDSSTQHETNTPQESELLRRHRKINASLPRGEEATKARSFSVPVSQPPLSDGKLAHAAPPPTNVEQERRDSKTYVSRLDPGSASSSFLSSTVSQQVTRSRATEVPSQPSTPKTSERRESQIAQNTPNGSVTPAQEKAPRRKSRSEAVARPVSTATAPRESRSRGAEPEQSANVVQQSNDRSDPRLPQTKLETPVKPAQYTQAGQSLVSQAVSPERKDRATSKSAAPSRRQTLTNGDSQQIPSSEQLQSEDRRSLSMSTTPYQTPAESPSQIWRSLATTTSPPTRKPVTPRKVTGPTEFIVTFPGMGNQSSQVVAPEETSNERPAASKIVPHPTVESSNVAREETSNGTTAASTIIPHPTVESLNVHNAPSSQMRFPTPAPQTEFPYLAGIEKGATKPSTSALEGYKVNRRGHILDEEGDIIGELTEGQIIHCVRRKVNAEGKVVDDSGKVVGLARALPQGPISPVVYEQQRGFVSEAYNESFRSPVSPATPHERKESASTFFPPIQPSQQSKATAERSLQTTKSEPKTVYFELDASVESQAVPILDHSEIFIPQPGGSQSQRNSRSATSPNETGPRAKRRQLSQSHSPSESRDRSVPDARRTSKKWPSTTKDDVNSISTAETEQAQSPRSYRMAANNAPKAVLGPTWESLLDTVPDSSQMDPQKVALDNRASVVLVSQTPAPRRASTGRQPTGPPLTMSGANGGNSAGSMTAVQSRRVSQSGINNRNSTHQPFAKSPLGSVGTVLVPVVQTYRDTNKGAAHAAPGPTIGNAGGDSERKVAAPAMGGMQTTSTSNNTAPVVEEDDQAAPAPDVMKWTPAKSTNSTKSGGKRKSFFGIPFGRREQAITA